MDCVVALAQIVNGSNSLNFKSNNLGLPVGHLGQAHREMWNTTFENDDDVIVVVDL